MYFLRLFGSVSSFLKLRENEVNIQVSTKVYILVKDALTTIFVRVKTLRNNLRIPQSKVPLGGPIEQMEGLLRKGCEALFPSSLEGGTLSFAQATS